MSKKGVHRKIYYYDVEANILDTNTNTVIAAQDQSFILKRAFQFIKETNDNIMGTDDEEKINEYLKSISYKTENGDTVYIIVDEIVDNYDKGELKGRPREIEIKYRIVLCRADAFPYIEKKGKLSSIISEVKGDFNIAEITHCVMFIGDELENPILGAEFNFNGARPSTIVQYIPHICSEIAQISCVGKIRKDAFKRIINGESCSLFEIGVKNTKSTRIILRNHFGIMESFLSNIPDMDLYEISIRRRKTKKKRGFDLPMSVDELQEIVSENREDISKFKVSQGTYKDAIDLLNDKLVCSKKFALTKNKCIDSNEIYALIINFFYSQKIGFKPKE